MGPAQTRPYPANIGPREQGEGGVGTKRRRGQGKGERGEGGVRRDAVVVVLAKGVEGVTCSLVVIAFMSFVWEFLVRAGGVMEAGLGVSGGPGVAAVRRRCVVFARVLKS